VRGTSQSCGLPVQTFKTKYMVAKSTGKTESFQRLLPAEVLPFRCRSPHAQELCSSRNTASSGILPPNRRELLVKYSCSLSFRRFGSCCCLLLWLSVGRASRQSAQGCLGLILLLLHVVDEGLPLRHTDGSAAALRVRCRAELRGRHGACLLSSAMERCEFERRALGVVLRLRGFGKR
jgi:hypothetical protein